MNEISGNSTATPLKRRSFFGSLVVAVVGGYLGGGILRGLFTRKGNSQRQRKSVKISIHPQAIPRAKESSKSNV
jgi:hypothetical protein